MGTSISRKGGSGYSLIEVMVALFVLSIGMLGVAGLSIDALKDSRSSLYRNKAVSFAWDMAERIRANRAAAGDYDTDSTTGADQGCFTTHSQVASQCTGTNLAAHDIWEWQQALQDVNSGGLPSGSGTIDVNTALTPAQYTITVNWTEGFDTNGNNDTQSVVVVTQL